MGIISVFAFLLVATLFLATQNEVHASIFDFWSDTGGAETVEFLKRYEDWLSYGNFLTVTFTWMGWGITKVLFGITSLVEGLIPETFSLLDFLDNSGLNSLTTAIINDLVLALMVLMLVYLGFKTIIAKEPPKFKNVGVNLLISGILLTGLPSLMNTMEDLSLSFYNATQTGENNEQALSLSWSLIQENTADLLYVGARGFNILEDGSSIKNGLSPDNFKRTALTALITPDVIEDVDSTDLKHLEYKLDQDENGADIAVKIEDSAFSFLSNAFEEGYFRYQVNFIPIVVGLIALAVAYMFTLFVFATTIIEIGFKQVLAPFVFATDLESGQKTKMVINDIMSAFLLIAFTGLSLRIYTTFLAFLGANDTNLVIYIVGIVSATFVLIKGSNTIMRYFGIDTGVKEGFGQLAGAFAVGRATKGGLSKMGSAGSALLNTTSTKDKLAQQSQQPTLEGSEGSTLSKSVESSATPRANGLKGIATKRLGGLVAGKAGSLDSATDTIENLATQGVSGAIQGATASAVQGKSINNASPLKESVSRRMEEDFQSTATGSQSESKGVSANNNINPSSSPQNLAEGQNNASDTQKQRINQELNSINAIPIEDETMRIGEQRERGNNDVAFSYKDILERTNKSNDSSENTEQIGNMKLNTHADKSINQGETQDIVQNTRANTTNSPTIQDQEINQTIRPGQATERSLNQEVSQETRTASSTNSPLRQEIQQDVQTDSHVGTNRQNVVSDVQSVTPSTNTARQNVVQDVQQAQNGSQTVRNNVVQDVQGGMNTNPAPARQNVTQDVKQASSEGRTVRNNVIQDVQQASNSGQTVRNTTVQEVQTQSVSMPQQATQRITQQFEKAGMFGISDQERQRVIQEVQQHASGSPEMKQKVVQQLEQANIATPAQATQNIEQAMKRVRVPQETQQVVQNVLQEVQTAGNVSTQGMKQKVVQELEKADFGAKEPIKELIIQDIQRSFSATPEQMTQNVKQVIDTVETQNLSSTATHEVNTNVTEERNASSTNNKKSYFNQLFSDDYLEPEVEIPVRKGKRFSALKGL